MAKSSLVRLATIQWDYLLDRMEDVIQSEKRVCCRALLYYDILDDAAKCPKNDVTSAEFGQVETALDHLRNLAHGLFPAQVLARIRRECGDRHLIHEHFDKPVTRMLADAEARLLLALHFNPHIHDYHICYLQYATAVKYGVELAASDDVFVLRQATEYANILNDVRNLFVSLFHHVVEIK
jgi:hypothetical protein